MLKRTLLPLLLAGSTALAGPTPAEREALEWFHKGMAQSQNYVDWRVDEASYENLESQIDTPALRGLSGAVTACYDASVVEDQQAYGYQTYDSGYSEDWKSLKEGQTAATAFLHAEHRGSQPSVSGAFLESLRDPRRDFDYLDARQRFVSRQAIPTPNGGSSFPYASEWNLAAETLVDYEGFADPKLQISLEPDAQVFPEPDYPREVYRQFEALTHVYSGRANNGDEKLSMKASYTENEIDLGILGEAKLTISTEADASRHQVIGELATKKISACNDTPQVLSFLGDNSLGFTEQERYAILCDSKYSSDRSNFQLPQNTPSSPLCACHKHEENTDTATEGQILRPWTRDFANRSDFASVTIGDGSFVHAKDWRLNLRVESSRYDTELLLQLPDGNQINLGRTRQFNGAENGPRRYLYTVSDRSIAGLLATETFRVEPGTELEPQVFSLMARSLNGYYPNVVVREFSVSPVVNQGERLYCGMKRLETSSYYAANDGTLTDAVTFQVNQATDRSREISFLTQHSMGLGENSVSLPPTQLRPIWKTAKGLQSTEDTLRLEQANAIKMDIKDVSIDVGVPGVNMTINSVNAFLNQNKATGRPTVTGHQGHLGATSLSSQEIFSSLDFSLGVKATYPASIGGIGVDVSASLGLDVVRNSRSRSHGDLTVLGTPQVSYHQNTKRVQIFDGYVSYYRYYTFGRTALQPGDVVPYSMFSSSNPCRYWYARCHWETRPEGEMEANTVGYDTLTAQVGVEQSELTDWNMSAGLDLCIEVFGRSACFDGLRFSDRVTVDPGLPYIENHSLMLTNAEDYIRSTSREDNFNFKPGLADMNFTPEACVDGSLAERTSMVDWTKNGTQVQDAMGEDAMLNCFDGDLINNDPGPSEDGTLNPVDRLLEVITEVTEEIETVRPLFICDKSRTIISRFGIDTNEVKYFAVSETAAPYLIENPRTFWYNPATPYACAAFIAFCGDQYQNNEDAFMHEVDGEQVWCTSPNRDTYESADACQSPSQCPESACTLMTFPGVYGSEEALCVPNEFSN